MAEFFTCENNHISLEQAIRGMIYDDGFGNPVININPEGSSLEPYFDCTDERKNLTLEQVLRDLIVQDENGNPVFNIAQS